MIFASPKAKCHVFFQRPLKNLLCRARRPILSFPTAVPRYPSYPPPGPTSCTSGPSDDDGDNRANGRKRTSYRTRTVQMHYQDRPGPKTSSFHGELTVSAPAPQAPALFRGEFGPTCGAPTAAAPMIRYFLRVR